MANEQAPTTKQVAEDLSFATELGDGLGYGYDAVHDAIVIERYSDDGEIEQTFRATLTIEGVN